MESPIEECRKYVEAYQKAGERTRMTSALIVVLAVTTLAAVLNGGPLAWPAWRVAQYARDEKMIVAAAHAKGLTPADDTLLTCLVKDAKAPSPRGTQALTSGEVKKLEERGIATYGDLKTRGRAVEELYSAQNGVTVPLAGVQYDISDVGLVGAVAYLVLAGLLYKAIRRESHNLRVAFDVGRKQSALRDSYVLLSLGEVLSWPEPVEPGPDVPQLPLRHSSYSKRSWLTRKIDKRSVAGFAVCLPLAVMAIISVLDFLGREQRMEYAPFHMGANLAIEWIVDALLLAITVETLRLLRDMRNDWRAAKEDIDKLP
jgi:hypothetical protein